MNISKKARAALYLLAVISFYLGYVLVWGTSGKLFVSATIGTSLTAGVLILAVLGVIKIPDAER